MTKHLREDQIIPYLDGRLEPDTRQPIERHLNVCPACRTRLEELRSVLALMNEWRAADPSPGLERALRERLAAETEKAESAWAWLRPRPALLLALALVLVAFAAFQFWPRPASDLVPAPQVVRVTPPSQTAPLPAGTLPGEGDDLALLDNPVLLENYELLEQFDILFEPKGRDEKRL
jgi:anti-sigma factor RsiW